MPMDVATFRKLVALDEDDPLSRFGLGQALLQEGGDAALAEAAEHLRFANAKDPNHLATYHVLGRVLVQLGHTDEARRVLTAGVGRVEGIGEGMGRDLGPAMAEMLADLDRA
ncbi:MAG: tetratricopeptide repeat protein [Phycisphaerales bacterium]|nr:tetratricopeptide repeat protein [Phycisphaerales bacterium]